MAVKITVAAMAAITRRRILVLFAKNILTSFLDQNETPLLAGRSLIAAHDPVSVVDIKGGNELDQSAWGIDCGDRTIA